VNVSSGFAIPEAQQKACPLKMNQSRILALRWFFVFAGLPEYQGIGR